MSAAGRFGVSLLLLAAGPAGAQSFSRSAAGTSAGEFLRLSVSARAAAMGEAYAAAADDAAALFYNPAGMSGVARNSVTVMHAPYLADTFFDFAGLVHKTANGDHVGVAIQYFDGGSVPMTDAAGQDAGTAHPYGAAATLAYSQVLAGEGVPDFMRGGSLGLSAKFVQARLSAQASTLAAGAGFTSRELADGRLKLGLSMDDLFGKLTFDQEADPLPYVFRLGASWKAQPNLLLVGDAVLAKDAPPALCLGVELGVESLALRAGFDSLTVGEVNGFTAFSAGIGIRQESWTFDYALVPFGSLGLAHRLSLTVRFPPDYSNFFSRPERISF